MQWYKGGDEEVLNTKDDERDSAAKYKARNGTDSAKNTVLILLPRDSAARYDVDNDNMVVISRSDVADDSINAAEVEAVGATIK